MNGVTVVFWGAMHLPQPMLEALVRAAGGKVRSRPRGACVRRPSALGPSAPALLRPSAPALRHGGGAHGD